MHRNSRSLFNDSFDLLPPVPAKRRRTAEPVRIQPASSASPPRPVESVALKNLQELDEFATHEEQLKVLKEAVLHLNKEVTELRCQSSLVTALKEIVRVYSRPICLHSVSYALSLYADRKKWK